jgi:two-component system LytT family sensor kinase
MTPALASTWSPNDTVRFGQLVGYGLSVSLALLLVTLVWRHSGPGRHARMLFAVCCAIWTLGGLTCFGLIAAGASNASSIIAWAQCVTFGAASMWPIALPLLWDAHEDLSARERLMARWIVRFAIVAAVVLIAMMVLARLGMRFGLAEDTLPMFVAYNAAVVLVAGAVLIFPHLQTRLERISVAMMPLGPVLTIIGHSLIESRLLPEQWNAAAQILTKQSIVLTIVGGLVYLGRFRGLDRFAKRGLQIKWAALLAIAAAWLIFGPLANLANGSGAPTVIWAAATAGTIAAAIHAFVILSARSDRWVERRVFGRVDPESALAAFRERLSREETVSSVIAAAEQFVRETLRVNARFVAQVANVSASDDAGLERAAPTSRALASECATPLEVGHRAAHLAPSGRARGAVSSRPAATGLRAAWCHAPTTLESFPVHVGYTEPLAMELDASEHRLLVTAEVDLARQTAHWVGRRLEALERERERLERSRREASLVHQLVEAELRALRAQINPHFLFNSLNTIAALVHDQPQAAEQMTLRLARIFRHVLKQTERPFSSLQEEMDFLRAYLDIEQIRFGERLKIDFLIADGVGDSRVPSLILQPLVENAIRHGLSSKLGECRLVITGRREDEHVLLSVEDNGVGMSNAGTIPNGSGIGLRNVRERLRTLYGERARFQFESQARLGSRAALYLPLAS